MSLYKLVYSTIIVGAMYQDSLSLFLFGQYIASYLVEPLFMKESKPFHHHQSLVSPIKMAIALLPFIKLSVILFFM